MSVDLSASIQSLERRRLEPDGDEEQKTLTIALVTNKLQDDETLATVSGLSFRKEELTQIDQGVLEACPSLKTLTLSRNNIQTFPITRPVKGKFNPSLLLELVLDHNQIVSVKGIADLQNLQHLSLMDNKLDDSSEISLLSQLIKLKTLTLEGNNLTTLSGVNLPHLESLNVSRNSLKSLEGCKMSRLADLRASHNSLTNLDGVERLLGLQDLDVSYNKIKSASGGIKSDSIASHRTAAAMSPLRALQNLSSLNLRHNQLVSLAWIPNLPHLTELLVGHNNLLCGVGSADSVSQISATPVKRTPKETKKTPVIDKIPVCDDIGQAEYGSEDEGVRATPTKVVTRSTSRLSTPSRCGSSASRRTSATATSTAASRNPLVLISKNCPVLETLDISNNDGFIQDASCLKILSKLSTLTELQVANSTDLTPDSYFESIYAAVNTLEIIDDHTVSKVNRLELTDLAEDGNATNDDSEQQDFEVTFIKTSKIEASQNSSNAWSTPGLRPSTATLDRPSTASKRPPMKVIPQTPSIGKSMSVVDCKEMMTDLMDRMLFVKRNVDTKVKSLSAVLSTLPTDVTKLPDKMSDVNKILKNSNALTVELSDGSTTPPDELSLAPTPPPQPQVLKLSSKPAKLPARTQSNPTLLGLKKHPHHLQKRSPQRLGRNLSFAEEQHLAKAKMKTAREIDEAILYHHINMMDGNQQRRKSSGARLLQREGSSDCGTQAGESHIATSNQHRARVSSSTCTDDSGIRPASTPSVQSQSSECSSTKLCDSSLPMRTIVQPTDNHEPDVMVISKSMAESDDNDDDVDCHSNQSDPQSEQSVVVTAAEDIRSYNTKREITEFPLRPTTPETCSVVSGISTPCRTPQSLGLTMTSKDQVPSIPKRPAGNLSIRSHPHKHGLVSQNKKIKSAVVVVSNNKQAPRGTIKAGKDVIGSDTSVRMRSLNLKMKRPK